MTQPLSLPPHRNPRAVVFSPAFGHRSTLTRHCGDSLPISGVAGHRPLTGGEYRSDRTVQHLVNIAKRVGRGGFGLPNLCAEVCTAPQPLRPTANLIVDAPEPPRGPRNLEDAPGCALITPPFVVSAAGRPSGPRRRVPAKAAQVKPEIEAVSVRAERRAAWSDGGNDYASEAITDR